MTEEQHEGLMGPIESGKSSMMPASPKEGEDTFEDKYLLDCDHLDIQPKSIVLPKFIFNPTLGYKEKGLLFLIYEGDHSTGIYAKVLQAVTKGFAHFSIKFQDPESEEVISIWEFEGARLHAVDFGNVAHERSTPAELALEIDYEHLSIDGVSI